MDTELRRIEASVNEIVQEMEYLRIREQKLRDTNESTNERVKWFALGTMGMLVGLGAWQVVYLRAYFRYVVHLRSLVWCKARGQLRLLGANGGWGDVEVRLLTARTDPSISSRCPISRVRQPASRCALISALPALRELGSVGNGEPVYYDYTKKLMEQRTW